MLYLGLAYFLLSLVYTVATSLPSGNHAADESEYDMLSMVVFVLAAVDTAFYVWTLTALNNLLGGLAARKQAAKYILYRNFRSVLFISLFATCVWVLYGSVINLNTGHGEDNNWKDHWTVDALWEATYFMIFVAIAVMWAPSKNSMRCACFALPGRGNDLSFSRQATACSDVFSFSVPQRYAYSVELSQLDNDDEWQRAGLGEIAGTASGGTVTAVLHGQRAGDTEDAEYGGALDDEGDPFMGSGALDTAMAVAKKQ